MKTLRIWDRIVPMRPHPEFRLIFPIADLPVKIAIGDSSEQDAPDWLVRKVLEKLESDSGVRVILGLDEAGFNNRCLFCKTNQGDHNAFTVTPSTAFKLLRAHPEWISAFHLANYGKSQGPFYDSVVCSDCRKKISTIIEEIACD